MNRVIEQCPVVSPTVTFTFYSGDGNPCAMATIGRAKKPKYNYRFKTPEERETWARKIAASVEADNAKRKASRQSRKDEAKARFLAIQPGDILYNSWGWEQTNIDWYQVVGRTSGLIYISRIHGSVSEHSHAAMSGTTVPIRGSFAGQPIKKRTLSMDYGILAKWDGKPKACSWYA